MLTVQSDRSMILCMQERLEDKYRTQRLGQLHVEVMSLKKENLGLRQELREARKALDGVKCEFVLTASGILSCCNLSGKIFVISAKIHGLQFFIFGTNFYQMLCVLLLEGGFLFRAIEVVWFGHVYRKIKVIRLEMETSGGWWS